MNTPTSGAAATAPANTPVNAPVTVSVNGETRRLAGATTLDALVATLTTARSGVAAAVNETVVPRGAWSGTLLGEGDRVEVLTAVQGG
ncbi:sulfur carrier protein ThiS [Streptomyces lichenis]|uniref:Sulfur carrier protein ThiS n=1 Tax=Streptomyces lichenis TaxID=2306967 RepID=A0ABT0IEB0_9ACTN|nr:sulfur carrier protein ThiS [Streptomyces lichenis]MCK8679664.1 sulfur carrier protein ThiS [Streptomyces lichenis]